MPAPALPLPCLPPDHRDQEVHAAAGNGGVHSRRFIMGLAFGPLGGADGGSDVALVIEVTSAEQGSLEMHAW